MAEDVNPSIGSPKLFPGLHEKSAEPVVNDESKNVFTELFGNDLSQKNAAMMGSVAKQSEKKGISYFGSLPKTPELSLKKLQKHKSEPGASVLKVAVLVFLLTAFAFATQTSARLSIFGVNPALRLATVQDQVSELKAEVLVQNTLAAALTLDQFTSVADEYLYAQAQVESVYTSTNSRENYQEDATELHAELVAILANVQGYFSGEFDAELSALALQVTDDLIARLQAQSGSVNEKDLQEEIRDLQTSRALIQDSAFRSSITGLNLEELSDSEIKSIFAHFSAVNASATATISAIQETRIAWSSYLDEIEALTKSVDPLFNTEFQTSLTLSNIYFEADGSITLSGETTTEDSKNFTLVSNLIDTYEASPYFENVQERSYSKNDSSDSYSGSFRITMNLEANPQNND